MNNPEQECSDQQSQEAVGVAGGGMDAVGGPPIPSDRAAPKPGVVGVVTFVFINVFFLRPESWLGVPAGHRGTRRARTVFAPYATTGGRSAWHQFAVVAGVLPTYACAGFILTATLRPDDMLAWTGNVLFASALSRCLSLPHGA